MQESVVDIMLELGLLSQEQLNNAINHQWENGGELEENLIKSGYFNENILFTILTRKFEYYPFDLSSFTPEQELLKIIPSWIVKHFLVIPIVSSGTSLAVTMMNPLDREAMDNLKKATYLDILPFVAPKSEIEQFIFKYYGVDMPEKEMEEVVEESSVDFTPLRKYNFDNFITGKCNDFAYSMSLSVARSYSEECNPLFIFSDCGMGKTHLLVAIWNYIIERQSQRKALYYSSDRFATELKQAVETRQLENFRTRFSKIDVLLIDDIGLIAGDEVTQQHFFNIFNDLFLSSKQIVVTSDRPPKELPTLSARLKSRFEGGLIARIDPPDLETRISILKFKARAAKISDSIVTAIAEKVMSNVRELEGIFKEIVAYSKYKNETPSDKIVEEILLRRAMLKPYIQ
ncbi:MAG: DnaA/Hda family protein [bacterium]